jgi:cysteine-rich repeat protein
MRKSNLGRLVFLLGLAVVAPACGEDEGVTQPPSASGGEGGEASGEGGEPSSSPGGGGAGGGYTGKCTPLSLGRPRLYFNVIGQLNGLRYPVSTRIGSASLPEYLLVELFDSTTEADGGFLPPLEAGEFDLTKTPNDSVTTCQHCVSLLADVTEGTDPLGFPLFQPAGWYFQSSGRLSLSEVHDPLNEELASSALYGGISGVELTAIDLDDPLQPFVKGGKCYYVSAAEFDTRLTPGKACEDVDDCGNEVAELCDPVTQRCVDESQCNQDAPCESGFCIQQSPLSPLGACYPSCRPFADGECPDEQTCVQYGISEKDGYCLWAGSAEVGDDCLAKDAVTDCALGAVCVDGKCSAQCGFFSSSPACAEGTACDVLGHCSSPTAGDPAELGEKCASGAAMAEGCALRGERFDGICFSYRESEPLRCEKSCFVDDDDYDGNADDGATDADCEPSEFCALRFSSGLGVCQPDPVCGDGKLGEVGEVCDDGDTDSEDGCSADCQTVEYGVLCAALPELEPNDTVEGDTAGGLDGFKSSCQFGTSRARGYQVSAPGPGQLKLTLTSDRVQVVAVRTQCDSAEAELGCGQASPGADGALSVQLKEPGAQTVTVLVNGATVLDEAPFTLVTEFTPQVCGDSLQVGAEACDDGNEESGDGCSADCSAIEYDVWCENAEVLPLDETVTGEIAGAPFLFTPSCGYGAGADRLYQLTAPRAGTLTVTLEQNVSGTETDLALTVLGTCGAPAPENELGCSAVVSPAEEVAVEVKKGQTVFVAVDGLFATAGKYQLRASLD